jgi:Flp pilus assembly protein TadD
LAAGVLLGLVGCHQIPSHLDTASFRGRGNDPSGRGGSITPAQEADVQVSMGRVAERQGNPEQAMAAYRAALTRDARRADAYLRLAVLHDQQGKFRESADLYRKALALRPGDPDIFCDMGYSFYLQRRWAESESNLRQAIAVSPDHQRAHNNLALLLVRDSRTQDALAEFRKGGSSPAQAHMNLAFALTMDQRWESARAEYERALALDPSLQVAKDRLGQLKTMLARLEKARGDLAPHDERVLTTSAEASSPRGEVSTASVTTAATARPPGSVRHPAVRDRGPDTASVQPPRRYTRSRLPAPALPVDDDAMRDLWASVDSAKVAPPRRPPALPPLPEAVSPDQRDPRPRSGTSRSERSASGPRPPADAPQPTRSGSGSPNPISSTSRSPKGAATGRPNLETPTRSKPGPPTPAAEPPRSVSLPANRPDETTSPTHPEQASPLTNVPRTPTSPDLPQFQAWFKFG